MTYRIKNWEKFQHYKDRSPEWIKLYGELLNDFEWFQLPGETAKVLVGLWLLAREDETRTGILPPIRDISFRLRLPEGEVSAHLEALSHWLEPSDAPVIPSDGLTPAQRLAAKNGFGSRHISTQVRIAIWTRDGGKCRHCGSGENIEYDHIIPISKGGNSDEGNVQLLCRPCNRKKRTRLPEQSEQGATHAQPLMLGSCSLEKETERERTIVQLPIQPVPRVSKLKDTDPFFIAFYAAYPRHQSKQDALKAYGQVRKSGVTHENIMAGLERAKRSDSRFRGEPKFIPLPASWLRAGGFDDDTSAPKESLERMLLA